MVLNKKMVFLSIGFSIILIGIINLMPSKNFFGPYYVDIYVLIPLLLIQSFTLSFFDKYKKVSFLINIFINLIIIFIAYRFVINS